MKISVDPKTRIAGFGRTQQEAISSMNFYIERSGDLSREHIRRREEIKTWLPTDNLLQIKRITCIEHKSGVLINHRTGREVRIMPKPMSHYLYLFPALDGLISYEDFTLTLGHEMDTFLFRISDTFMTLQDFPPIKPVDSIDVKVYHSVKDYNISIIETKSDTIVFEDADDMVEIDKVPGITNDCLLAYLLASKGYLYDGYTLRRIEDVYSS